MSESLQPHGMGTWKVCSFVCLINAGIGVHWEHCLAVAPAALDPSMLLLHLIKYILWVLKVAIMDVACILRFGGTAGHPSAKNTGKVCAHNF
jgi:hypothetical protein